LIYQQLRQRSLRVLRAPLARPALLEISPLLAVLIALWLKLAYFTCLISSELWLAEEPRPWVRLALYVLSCLVQHPHIVTATLATLLVLFAPFWMLSRTWRFVSVLLLDFVLTILGLVDLVHVRFYADVVAVSDLALAPALGGVLPSILKGLQWTDALYGCDIIIGCALLPGYASSCKRIPAFDRVDRGRIAIALAVFGLILGAPTALTVWRNKGELFSYVSLRIEAASTLGILPYHVADALIHFAPAKAQVDAAARERVHRFLSNHYSQTPSVSPISGIARGRNVIVISAESLQAFPIGLVIDGQPISPRLSAFATESLEFVNFYDQTHLGTTSDAEFMAMQSLHPLPARVVVNDLHYHYFRGLPKILSEHGYATLSLCAAIPEFWRMDQMHPRLGFQKSYFEESYRITERIHQWLPDHEFFAQSIAILQKQSEPFMAFLLSGSNHHPFQLPHHYRKLKLGSLEGTLLGDYLHSVHYFDRAFGEFVDGLRHTGLLDKSLIVVYGDHHGFLGDPPELARLLGYSAVDEFRVVQTRKKVPLFIRLPYGREAGIRNIAGGHLDIAPTVLSLLGILDDRKVMLGVDLTATRDSPVVFRDGSFVDGEHFFIKRVGSASAAACYDVKTGRASNCESLQALRRVALERLEVSDLIVRGDLIRELTERQGRDRQEQ
jgi:lipoteichoic acid synthase